MPRAVAAGWDRGPARSEDVGGEGRERTEPARNHEFVYVGLLGDIAANQLVNIIFNIIWVSVTLPRPRHCFPVSLYNTLVIFFFLH